MVHKKIIFLIFVLCNLLQAEHFLSFVMPCYNCAHTVGESIDSIYQQNLNIPFEVVCTDDGSTDSTLKVLREYEKKYSNLKVIVHEINKGGGAANNTCVANSQGDLLFRLDSDNILAPGSINALIDLLDVTGCDGASFHEIRFFVRDSVGDRVHTKSALYTAKDNICDLHHALSPGANPMASGNYLYTRRSFDRAGGYPNQKSGTDTHCFGLKQYMTGSKIAISPGTFYWHFYNENGYYCREERTGSNRRVVWTVLKEFKELFNEKTKAYLQKVDIDQVDPWVAMQSGKLELLGSK